MFDEKYSLPINNGLDIFITFTLSNTLCKFHIVVLFESFTFIELELELTPIENDFHDRPPDPDDPDKSNDKETQLPIKLGPEI